ncbi:MAG: DUF721 domain-containing protein [Gammaproteobacteria bacterium]|nr:DUF721 domain-containing protein [Gammaproteobacteria bacterium]
MEKLLEEGPGDHLGKIVHIARNMGELTEALRAGLSEDLAAQLVAAATRENGELVVVASSSAWAARLRFETASILASAQRHGLDVSGCRFIVQTSPEL